MSDSAPDSRTCPKCHSPQPADAAEGLCPRCLMAEAMQPTGPAKAWEPPTAAELGELLPGYDVHKLLGRGGMGAVYKGSQKSLDRPVAIKILSATLDESDQGFADRFKNEARALAKLKHPSIVGVYDFGTAADGLLYIVMEYIDGTDVSRMLAKEGRLHTDHAMAITAHVCDALIYAHERGIIHRDIKPANIMVGYDGNVKVADFGLAKMTHAAETGLTQSGMAMGTLHYMAPECLMLGGAVDHRADIYAVGVMLYQMLTGKLPKGLFKLPSLQIAGLDPRYDGIIGKALREDREVRYQSILEMRADLDSILTQPVVKVEPRPTDSAETNDAEQARWKRENASSQAASATREKPKSSPLLWAVALAVVLAATFVGWTLFNPPAKAPSASTPTLADVHVPEDSVVTPIENDTPLSSAPKAPPETPPTSATPTATAAPEPVPSPSSPPTSTQPPVPVPSPTPTPPATPAPLPTTSPVSPPTAPEKPAVPQPATIEIIQIPPAKSVPLTDASALAAVGKSAQIRAVVSKMERIHAAGGCRIHLEGTALTLQCALQNQKAAFRGADPFETVTPGQIIIVHGPVQLFHDRLEIVLTSAHQWIPHSPDYLPEKPMSEPARVFANASLRALDHGREPGSSHDESITPLILERHKGSLDFVQHDFSEPKVVEGCEVFWTVGSGPLRLPRFWKVLYLDEAGFWLPVSAKPDAPVADRWNVLRFDPVRTQSLRLMVQPAWASSSGFHEWKILPSSKSEPPAPPAAAELWLDDLLPVRMRGRTDKPYMVNSFSAWQVQHGARVLLDGAPCSRYLYTGAPFTVSYAVPPGYSRFRTFAIAPLDGSLIRRSWSYQVKADDEVVFQSKSIRSYPNLTIEVDVKLPPGTKTLTLITHTNGMWAAEHAIWAHPRLLHDDAP